MGSKPEQLIIAISREFGSGGRAIADLLSQQLSIPVYEKNLLQNLGIRAQEDVEDLYYRDESPRWKLTSRTVRGLTNSNEEALAAMEFDFLREMAQDGQSFIILGHCAEEVLCEFECLITIFISADEDFKLDRIMKENGIDREAAIKKMKRHNWKRKNYHNSYCTYKWGDSRNYMMCLKSNELGIEKTAQFIEDYVDLKYS